MKELLTSKKAVIPFVILLAIIAFTFVNCSSNSSKESKADFDNSLFKPRSTTTTVSRNAPNDMSTETTPIDPYGLENLKKTEKTGVLNPSLPEHYISPRWEAILGGDPSSGIPLEELNNPENSDLDLTTFTTARTTAITLANAVITGENIAQFATYFQEVSPGNCRSFSSTNAGATSLPIPNDNRWIIAIVYWSAQCSGTQIKDQMQLYFKIENSKLVPVTRENLPRS